jgi:serine protease AprX
LILPQNRVVGAFNAVRGREVEDFEGDISEGPPASAWHGTMAAAVAAGSGYLSKGDYRGVASEAKLVLVKGMTPEGRIRTPQVRRALRWILKNHERLGVRIVNLSVGVDESTRSLRHPVIALVEELVERGVTVVAAAGNNPGRPIVPPGSAPSAITVGGYNDNNSLEWSDREMWHGSWGKGPTGGQKPELLGPAIYVAAPVLLGTQVKAEAETLFWLAGSSDRDLMGNLPLLSPETGIADKLLKTTSPLIARGHILERIRAEKLISPSYKHVDGTSFAAPIVSSIVAQMIEADPQITPQQIRARLFTSARRIEGIPEELQGYGMVGVRS